MHPRIAVVTGANKGIGYEIAKQLLTTCTVVVLACRNKELGEAAVKQLASPKARFMQCDISDAASIAAFADTFSAEVGALDVLVNNAAIAFKGADPTPFEGQTGPTLRTNYKGTVALTERMLPLLEKSANGSLVNIASMAGRLGQVSAERQAQFTAPTLTTEELTALADEFAATFFEVSATERGAIEPMLQALADGVAPAPSAPESAGEGTNPRPFTRLTPRKEPGVRVRRSTRGEALGRLVAEGRKRWAVALRGEDFWLELAMYAVCLGAMALLARAS